MPRKEQKGEKKWWYNVAVLLVICAFLMGFDYFTSGALTWSIWPVGAFLFFVIAMTILEKVGRK